MILPPMATKAAPATRSIQCLRRAKRATTGADDMVSDTIEYQASAAAKTRPIPALLPCLILPPSRSGKRRTYADGGPRQQSGKFASALQEGAARAAHNQAEWRASPCGLHSTVICHWPETVE